MDAPLLEARNLTIRFSGLVAVSEVSFHLARNEILCVIGPNGAGKSTLFNLISGIYRPNAGQIFLEGRDITGLAPHRVADAGAHEARAALVLVQPAVARAQIALDATVVESVPPAAREVAHRFSTLKINSLSFHLVTP
mgnify:CR=1 FL=1